MSSSDLGDAQMSSASSTSASSSGPSTPPLGTASLPLPKSLADARKQQGLELQHHDIAEWQQPHTFHTLDLFERFSNPSQDAFDHPELQKLVAPHIESFNMLWASDPSVDEPGPSSRGATTSGGADEGLMQKAIRKIAPKVIYNGKGASPAQWENGEWARTGDRLEIWVDSISLGRPQVHERARDAKERRVFPTEARERLVTYRAPLTARIQWSINGSPPSTEVRQLGLAPVMVKSNRCNLRGMTSKELVNRGEEQNEMGGYFIINGNERLVRFLIVPKANHVTAIERSAFEKRGPSYSRKACTIRCVPKEDLASVTNTVHYLENGSVTLRFSWRKQEYMVPVILILKALVDATDKEIFTSIVQGDFDNTFITDRVELLLRAFKNYKLYSGAQCLEYLGDKFRVVMGAPEDWENIAVGARFIEQVVLIHLDSPREKFRMLVHMIRKLYSFVALDSCQDNEDSPQHQEILLPGFLYGQIIKERVDDFLGGVRTQIARDVRQAFDPSYAGPSRSKIAPNFYDESYLKKVMAKVNSDVGARLNAFLATGNLVSQTGLDLKQASGFTIVAEKLNFYRYLSHFRCVHRGAFFAELKTTTVRKLLPEAWGFLCPVHTPDGSPCGLLNHFSHTCQLMTRVSDTTAVPSLLAGLGMLPALSAEVHARKHVCIQLDGTIIGYATLALAKRMAMSLRIWKTEGQRGVPLDLEIGLVPLSHGGQYPGLYLFSNRARMMRPVKFLYNGKLDLVGPFEQVYLDIACQPDEVEQGITTHLELSPTSVLSVLANLTPFSDYNQSPRNMYQCQMGKQTMGTPSTAINHRTDNKLYRIQNPQTPVVRPALHNKYSFDDYPNGTNAIVAVISYTGYDMEDAMILNKSAHERGFGYGSVYKSSIVDLRDLQGSARGPSTWHFGFGRDLKPDHPSRAVLDNDGMPFIGARIKEGEPYCAYWDETTGRTKFSKLKGDDIAYVDTVRVIGTDQGDSEAQKLQITLRIPRSPVIGDKFSSRHGQKGVCSQKWPAVDMPFSESGMQPDVIINPHAFPSRMTIGMLIESMAGKAGAMHGIAQDSTPFTFSEEDTPLDFFGEQLKAAGYNYLGHEPMYSGVTGEEFAADIYLGVVYYQRLRHMVNDKFQVRTTGPVDQRTRQPVKGRKRAGGIRFGEMERDALLAHGTSYLLQDRLMNCSDYSTAWVCRTCGSLISLGYENSTMAGVQAIDIKTDQSELLGPSGEYCRICRAEDERRLREGERPLQPGQTLAHKENGSAFKVPKEMVLRRGGSLDVIAVPYVLKYLVAELAAMSMRISFEVVS
ncbi:DNA-directed RNA polymerase I polypeptide 2 [Tilletiaria anomala UBC 951]|uniref:DNA-directed RNA polymerase subunit beta n=1 Tax=Tilletiaria anomala (strain ATCC 24038 / CBS 436.72 / UBC 951) TaxID=1037660 RepID=A0A066VT74_TILAU|nr:DNA-directed RNA polymerase I polypeptide 2 [Tilletiaria anomala UBC 951]KDN44902.1 DNA-directed RNA polymerase I polypeptide 2 [Tilletiaria anomala UBC 951]